MVYHEDAAVFRGPIVFSAVLPGDPEECFFLVFPLQSRNYSAVDEGLEPRPQSLRLLIHRRLLHSRNPFFQFSTAAVDISHLS